MAEEEPSDAPRSTGQESKDVDRVTDLSEEVELDANAASRAVAALHATNADKAAQDEQRERELAAVHVEPADVALVSDEMELDKAAAERALREHKGDVVLALNALVASG
jgi:NACalpha-BTF3-like transcription factor